MPEIEHGGILKSQHSMQRSYVLFRNCTDRLVDVIWIGYNGEFVHYATLKPTDCKMINTFATHPWVFRDPDTGERMHVRGKDVYMPQPYRRGQINRYLVPIQFPMRSLRTNTLWRISQLMIDFPAVHQLELPRSLISDLLDIQDVTAKAIQFKQTHPGPDDGDEQEDAGEGGD